MKKLLSVLLTIISLTVTAQHYESDVRAHVKIKRGKKIKTKEIIYERDTVCLSNNLVIIRSQENTFIDVEVIEETDEWKKYKGDDEGMLCYLVLFKTQTPKTLLISYGEWGVVYFLDEE